MASAGGMPHRDLDAALVALLAEGFASVGATVDFMRALDEETGRIDAPPERPRPAILPSYAGTRRQRNLTPLFALLLRRFGVPVIVHGMADVAPVYGGASARPAITADVMRELGIVPATSLADARAQLARDNLAFVPLRVLAPRFAPLLAADPGREAAPTIGAMARLIDPCGGDGYRVIGVARTEDLPPMRAFLTATRARAMLLAGAEGEPFADPLAPSLIEQFTLGVATVCTAAETAAPREAEALPAAPDAAATAEWIAKVLAGVEPIPAPILVQLACCLHGTHRPHAAAAAMA